MNYWFMQQHGWISMQLCRAKEARQKKRAHIVQFHVSKTIENGSEFIVSESKLVVCLGVEKDGERWEGKMKNFRGSGYVCLLSWLWWFHKYNHMLKPMTLYTLKCAVYWIWVISP